MRGRVGVGGLIVGGCTVTENDSLELEWNWREIPHFIERGEFEDVESLVVWSST